MARAWYIFNSNLNDNGQYAISNYRIIGHGTKPACVNGLQICAIYVSFPGTEKPSYPLALSNNITQYITDAIATQVAQPQIPTDAKRYVYLKNVIA